MHGKVFYPGLALFLFCHVPSFSDSPLTGRTIALDPGHAVIDFQGSVINPGKKSRDGNVHEHKVACDISQKLGELLKEEGAKVIFTRTPSDYWRQAYTAADDNKARALLANELNANVFISIHCDWDPRSKIQGVTTYYKTPESLPLGENIHRSLIKELKAENRHLKRDSYTVLDQAAMPAVLIETGFLSHRGEAKKLSTPDYQKKAAQAIAAGLRGYFAN